MILNYTFEIMGWAEDTSLCSYNRIDPPLKRTTVEIDYDYQVDITLEDFADFVGCEINENTKDALEKVLSAIGGILEDSDEFIEFMTDRYEDEAREQCEWENE